MLDQCTSVLRDGAHAQSSPFKLPSPRIPFECLYYVVEHLHNDFETLRSLLYVDKFFFRTAIPYLIKDHISHPVENWFHSRSRSEKLFALILASFLEARLKELRAPPDSSELAEIVLEKILERFGLRLAKPFTLPGHQMLRSFLRRIDDMPEDHNYNCYNRKYRGEYGQEFDGNTPAEMDSGMTIDYSKFIPKIPIFTTEALRVHSMIQLCKLPKDVAEFVSPALYIQSGYGRVEKHSIEHQVDDAYLKELHEAFSRLWQHYNRECTDSFTLDIANAQIFLPFSKEMPKLHTLCLNRYAKMTTSHLKYTVLFIKQNQETFPNKPPLYIQFGLDQWDLPQESYSSLGNNNLKTTLAEIKCRRDELFQYMKPLITIHEAVGEPPFFNISNIPYFYEHADGIKLNRLWGLFDLDENRIDQGEGPTIEPFLRRCSALKILCIGAGSPDILSWAANEVLDTNKFLTLESGNESMSNASVSEIEPTTISNDSKQHPQQNPRTSVAQPQAKILGCIESLSIQSSRPYRFGLQIINDASIAFSTSLRVIEITPGYDHYFSSSDVPAVVRRQHFKKSFQLYDTPSANGVGNWPFFMPRLQEIRINLSRVASIQVGTFDQSPNIEDIDIEFGSVTVHDCRPSDGRPLPPPESDEYLDYQWLQPKIDKSLFPIWNLQKLKNLQLCNLAALRFDFASLSNTPCLEKLDLDIYYFQADVLIGVNEYKNIQIRAWKDRLRLGTDIGTGRYKPAAAARPWMWPLPVLVSLHISGPPATMFSLDWLLVCPKLEEVKLVCPREPQTIGCVPFFASRIRIHDFASGNGCNSNGPYLESHLRSFELEGNWLMSRYNLIQLLTIYAPFLRRLCVSSLGDDWDGYSFVKTIMDASDINSDYSLLKQGQWDDERNCVAQVEDIENEDEGERQQSSQRLPGCLIEAGSSYVCDEKVVRNLKLVEIRSNGLIDWERRNVTVFSMNKNFIHQDSLRIVNIGG